MFASGQDSSKHPMNHLQRSAERPNLSIERTSSGKLRLPAAAAHVER
jgi:hypothetical protein